MVPSISSKRAKSSEYGFKIRSMKGPAYSQSVLRADATSGSIASTMYSDKLRPRNGYDDFQKQLMRAD